MSAENWRKIVADLSKKENIDSFLSNSRQKLTSIFEIAEGVPTDLVGLDIGPERIRLLKINSGSTPFQVVEYATKPLPSGVIVKDEIKNADAIGTALRDLIRETGSTAKFAAVAIPKTLAIIKSITVDKRFSADDIESRAWIEANRQFPDLVGNIYLDFTITGPSTQNPDQLDLLIVACRKEHIKTYLEVIQMAGLQPVIVDVDCYALERSLQVVAANQTDEAHTIALLNVNVSQSSLIVLSKQNLIYAHDQSFDGQRLLKQVDEFIKSKITQAGNDEVTVAASEATYRAILQEGFLSHLRHTIHFFYSSRSNISIDKIFIAGDLTIIPDFAAFIEMELGIKTVLAEPFVNMKINASLDAAEIQKDAPALMLCCGLALSRTGE